MLLIEGEHLLRASLSACRQPRFAPIVAAVGILLVPDQVCPHLVVAVFLDGVDLLQQGIPRIVVRGGRSPGVRVDVGVSNGRLRGSIGVWDG